ncbi:MAG: hypothetical protein ACREP2_09055, partial [Rhodanobacteraceae bacterium]
DLYWGIFDYISNDYDKQNKYWIYYENLPQGVQNALMDLAYNFGYTLSSSKQPVAVQNLWSSALAQNWTQVVTDFTTTAKTYGLRYSRDGHAVQRDEYMNFIPFNGTKGLCHAK